MDKKCIICGETDSEKFYSWPSKICRRCYLDQRNKQSKDKYLRIRKLMRNYFDNKCISCGYDQYNSALSMKAFDGIHHHKNIAKTQEDTIIKDLPYNSIICRNCLYLYSIHKITQDDFLYKEGYVIGPHGIEKKFLIPKEEGIE